MSKKSQDIRSFFTVVSKKTVTSPEPVKQEKASKKRSKTDTSNEEDFILSPIKPSKSTKEPKAKKLKRIVLVSSSDSEDEHKTAKSNGKHKSPDKTKNKQNAKKLTPTKVQQPVHIKKTPTTKVLSEEKEVLPEKRKYVSLLEAFGNSPVEQTKIKSEECKVHEDEDFEKTLMELDDEEWLESVDTPTKGKKIKSESNSSEKESPKKKKQSSSGDSDVIPETPIRKRKISETEDHTNPDLARYEKKRYSAMLYQRYLNRKGPAHLGSKILPKGKPDCLKGCIFVITGVLDSLNREDAAELITSHGGNVSNSVTKKVNYVLCGDDAGPAKIEKAKNQGAHIIIEDELIDLICSKSGIINENKASGDSDDTSPKKIESKKAPEKKEKENKIPETKKNQKKIDDNNIEKRKTKEKIAEKYKVPETKTQENKTEETKSKIRESPANNKLNLQSRNESKLKTEDLVKIKNVIKTEETSKVEIKPSKSIFSEKSVRKPVKIEQKIVPPESLIWVDKYKPKTVSDIIGQQGEKSNAMKLMKWLQNWNKKNHTKFNRPSMWHADNNGFAFKAALLSGPPGVGKSTTATIVSKQLGFDVIEFNASNTRNKRMLQEEVSQLLSTKSIYGYFSEDNTRTNKHVLLMDEVDGMSGNEDRGGIQELISLIKNTKIPIICMCNDRNHQKLRTLAGYCFDLRFIVPRFEQIKSKMKSICYKENIDISSDALQEIIVGARNDIRQTLNNLAMWSAGKTEISVVTAIEEAKKARKDFKLDMWEVTRNIFTKSANDQMMLGDKFKLFFNDYSLVPLFMQENYLRMDPACAKKNLLKRVANAADSISMGNIIDTKIRSTQNWSLLESHALFSCVLPGEYMKGTVKGKIDFPSWLGKNSKRTKIQRLVTELQCHMRMSISGDRMAVNLDYASHLKDTVLNNLHKNGSEGIPKALEIMQSYNLLREDLNNLVEVTQWPKMFDVFSAIDPKVKTAFTRAYNKSIMLPYAVTAPVKKKTMTSSQNEEYEEYEDDNNEQEKDEDDDVNNDAMIKAKPMKDSNASTSKAGTSKAGASKAGTSKAGTSKAKAPAKPRAKIIDKSLRFLSSEFGCLLDHTVECTET